MANNETEPHELLTVHEVAKVLRCDDTTVRRWIKNGALEAIALPHRGKRQGYRVRRKTLDNLLNGSALDLEKPAPPPETPAPRRYAQSRP